jgi:cysteine-rich repeat protein
MSYPQSKNIFISYFIKSPLLFFLLTIVSLFSCFIVFFYTPSHAQVPDKDAIAIRVIPNPKNSSPQRWYKEQGFKGSPQSLTVDGYEAIRDGRTVYVNAANVVSGKLWTNIYLISYNQEAEKETIDIFAKVLEHWKFNTNIAGTGFCSAPKKATVSSSDCTGTIGCWHFDGNFNDSSVRVNNGNPLGGVGFTDGIYGQAINFDGINDYVTLDGLLLYRDNPSWTFIAWVKGSSGSIFSEGDVSSTWPGFVPLFALRTLGGVSKRMNVQAVNSDWQGEANINSNLNIYDNSWKQIVITKNTTGTGGDVKIYVNGILDNNNSYTAPLAGNLVNLSASTIGAFRRKPGVGGFFNGAIDEVKIYNYVLSGSEILNEYNNVYSQCLSDSECSGGGYCTSPKANIIRDTKRLSDLVELKMALENYKAKNGKYPSIPAGTYINGKTVSTWPSWQETLGKELGATLPNDPINRLGGCEGYDPITCWSEKDKKFADPDNTNNIFELPMGSNAFVYVSNDNALNYNLCSSMQSGYVSGTGSGECPQPGSLSIVSANGNNQPQFLGQSQLIGKTGEQFIGYISASDPDGDPLKWTIYTGGSSWSSTWSGAPVLQNSSAANQKRIYAGVTGSPGDYYISITIDDGKGDVNSTNTINLTIKAINLPPVISFKNINYTPTRTGPNPADITPLDFSFQVKDSPSNYPLTITSIVPLVGTAVPGFSQTFVQTPKTDYFLYRISGFPTASPANVFNNPSGDNPSPFTLTVQDSYGVGGTADFTITIKNTAPFITIPASCSNTIKVNDTYSCQIGAVDAEKHLLTYSLVGGTFPASFLVNSNGLISGTPPISDAGVYDIKVRVSDEYGYFTEKNYSLKIDAFCGDGAISGTEQCDDGNTIDTDACDSSCQSNPLCGDGAVQAPNIEGVNEECDDGNSIANDSCNNCIKTYCGDGVVQTPNAEGVSEECDDGNSIANDSCDNCIKTYCGDGAVQAPNSEGTGGPANNGAEDCDYGGDNSCCNTCAWSCTASSYESAALNFTEGSQVLLSDGATTNILFPDCRIYDPGNILVDAELVGIAKGTAVVFITDRSTSMPNNADMGGVKSALVQTITALYNSATIDGTDIKVGLISFGASNDVYPLTAGLLDFYDMNSVIYRDGLIAEVNSYADNLGSTRTRVAVQLAYNALSARSEPNKIMVLLSDGNPTNGYEPDTILNTAKGNGMTIYTIAYTDVMALKQTMCNWSSGTTCISPDYINQYAYASTDAAQVYQDITADIIDIPSGDINAMIGGETYTFTASGDFVYNIPLNFSGVSCTGSSQLLPFGTNFAGGGQIRFFNARINYCPACD